MRGIGFPLSTVYLECVEPIPDNRVVAIRTNRFSALRCFFSYAKVGDGSLNKPKSGRLCCFTTVRWFAYKLSKSMSQNEWQVSRCARPNEMRWRVSLRCRVECINSSEKKQMLPGGIAGGIEISEKISAPEKCKCCLAESESYLPKNKLSDSLGTQKKTIENRQKTFFRIIIFLSAPSRSISSSSSQTAKLIFKALQ